MSKRVIVTYSDATRTREVRGELRENNSHIVVILSPEEREGDGWKPIPEFEKLEFTRRFVVSVGHCKVSGVE